MRNFARLFTPFAASVSIAALAVLYGLVGLRFHGVTSDSPSLFYAGDRTLYWLSDRDVPGALDFLGPDPPAFHSDFHRDPEFEDPMHYPVFPGLAAAVTSRIFHDRLGWVDAIDGHHLALILLHAFALFVECLLLTRLVGQRAAVAATLALALFPSAVGQAFNNAKDWPCAQFYACAILAVAIGIIEQRGRWLLMAGVFTGLALASKLNGVFVFVTILLWTPFAYVFHYYRQRDVPATVVAGYLSGPYVAGGVFLLLWPWLYQGLLPDWWAHISEYVRFMVTIGRGTRQTWTDFPLRPLIFMTPPLVLACASVYLALGWRHSRRRAGLWSLFCLWLAVPILRIAAPRSNFLDANRHFIEYIPALCVMAGCGFDMLCDLAFGETSRVQHWLERRSWGWVVRPGLYVACLGVLVVPIATYAPYETTYFNRLIGGLRGAQRGNGLFTLEVADLRLQGTEGDYWFNSLRTALNNIRAQMHGEETIGLCGPSAGLARANWGNSHPPKFSDSWDAALADPDAGAFVYVMPRGVFCEAALIERLQRGRPVLERVERGGGLIYLVLGPRP
jgi:hypothetical protein